MKTQNIRHILDKVKRVAQTDKNVLILGEFGTGKSWVAHQIHALNKKSANSFMISNCLAFPDAEIEKKIFGYQKHINGKKITELGILEKSNHGVLFFKDFDGLSECLQKRVIEVEKNKYFQRPGTKDIVPLDVRLISSCRIDSVSDLKKNKTINRLRSEINPAIIFCPPLRQRREDIIWLVHYFLSCELNNNYEFVAKKISPQALLYCLRYDWPGNIKQLKNAIRHAAILANSNTIRPEHLANTIKKYQPNDEKLSKLRKSSIFRKMEEQLMQKIKIEGLSKKKITQILEYKRDTLIDKMIEYHLSRTQASNLFNYLHTIIKR